MAYTVYKHTAPNGKVYIGITFRKPETRWSNGNGYSRHKHFYGAIKKYGWENIKHEILFENLSKEDACQKEIELIAQYKSNISEFGYNKSTGGELTSLGFHHSDETKRKISDSRKGEKNCNYGKHFSEEHKRKISEAQKGAKSKKAKKVICVETGKVYCSLSEAAQAVGTCKQNICLCCNGKAKTAFGYHWAYYEE